VTLNTAVTLSSAVSPYDQKQSSRVPSAYQQHIMFLFMNAGMHAYLRPKVNDAQVDGDQPTTKGVSGEYLKNLH
jgi:hypothetical protein